MNLVTKLLSAYEPSVDRIEKYVTNLKSLSEGSNPPSNVDNKDSKDRLRDGTNEVAHEKNGNKRPHEEDRRFYVFFITGLQENIDVEGSFYNFQSASTAKCKGIDAALILFVKYLEEEPLLRGPNWKVIILSLSIDIGKIDGWVGQV
ncbi:hypothetical protein Tco_0560864, partial [Tanacetum coccineum]